MREMKDSGIAWIGEIPREWEVANIGACTNEVACPNTDCSESNALQFKMGSIISKKGGDSKYHPDTLAAYTKVKKGDIVINGLNLSFDLISQRVGLVRETGVITSTYLTLRPTELLYSNYLAYLFKAYDNCKAFHGMGRGLRQILSYNELKKYFLVLPPLSEQHLISSYLDAKCSEIDSALSLQEQMISELRAYKQSLITETVTHGLNPNAKMKNSGVEWIGEVPEGWEVGRLKDRISFINGYAFKSDNFTIDVGVNVIRIGDIGEVIDFKGCVKAVVDDVISLQPYKILENDILIAMSGATTGKCCIAKDVDEAYINQRVGIIRSTDYAYIYYSLQTNYLQEYINLHNAGSAQPNISSSAIGNYPIPLPPLSEQRSIASFLDEKCAEIDALIVLREKKMEALKEYKKSLIYECVTGKKQVI